MSRTQAKKSNAGRRAPTRDPQEKSRRYGSRVAIACRFLLGIVFAGVVTLAVWPHLPRRYYSEARVVMLTDVQDGLPDPSRAIRAYPDEAVTQSQIDLIASPKLAAQVVEKCRLLEDPEFTDGNPAIKWVREKLPSLARFLPDPVPVTATTVRRRLEKRLFINRDRKSYTVSFGYWSRDPGDAAAMTQALLDAYSSMQSEQRNQAIERISGWLDARVSAVKEQTLRAEDQVRSFMETSGLVDEGAQASLERELAELSADAARAQTDRVRAQIKASTLQAMQSSRTLQNAPEMIASPSVQKLREALASAYSSRPNALVPQSSILTEQINAEGDRLVAAAMIEAKETDRRMAALDSAITSIRLKLADRARARLHLEDLRREATADSHVLEVAMEKARERTDLAMSVSPEIEVAGLPEPAPKPAFPNPLFGLVGALLAGCLVGVLLNWRDVAPILAAKGRLTAIEV